jgi:TIR domain
MAEPIPYRCFISYTHDDNDDHDAVVDRLKKEMAGRFEAATGSRLEVFLDRESIGWGERWRDRIADAIAGSTLFVPIITMRYFNSGACREEFSAFFSAADRKGVSDLILPVILSGSDRITSENSDDLIRIVAELNWKKISEGWEAGYGSSAWKGQVGAIVKGLQEALSRAADRLSSETLALHGGSSTSSGEDLLSAIDAETIENRISDIGVEFESLEPLMQKISSAVAERLDGRDLARMTTAQRGFFLGALSDDIRQPAADFGAKAASIESLARALDAEFRAFVAEMWAISPETTRPQLDGLRSEVEKTFNGIQGGFTELDEIDKAMRMAALASVRLRKSLAPLSSGLRSLGVAMQVISSWRSIDPGN